MITLLTGCMWSGKSTELIRRIDRACYAGQTVALYKYSKDVRHGVDRAFMISSHSEMHRTAIPVSSLKDVHVASGTIIGIDEGQFIDYLVEFAEEAASRGCTVIIAALSSDYMRNAFEKIVPLIPKCDKIITFHAVCFDCGKKASWTRRTSDDQDVEVIGGKDKYKAVCRRCYGK